MGVTFGLNSAGCALNERSIFHTCFSTPIAVNQSALVGFRMRPPVSHRSPPMSALWEEDEEEDRWEKFSKVAHTVDPGNF